MSTCCVAHVMAVPSVCVCDIQTLLALYYQAQKETGILEMEPEVDDQLDILGTLAEEQRAIEDEYYERETIEDYIQHRYDTRRREETYIDESPSPPSNHVPTIEDIDSDVEFVYAKGAIVHQEYTSDEAEFSVVNKLFQSLIGRPGQTLVETFEEHTRNRFSKNNMRWVPFLKVLFLSDLASVKVSPILYESDYHKNFLANLPPDRIIYSTIVLSLLYSPVSESECERVFSRLNFITGKRRYNLSLNALNHCLLVSYHSHASSHI